MATLIAKIPYCFIRNIKVFFSKLSLQNKKSQIQLNYAIINIENAVLLRIILEEIVQMSLTGLSTQHGKKVKKKYKGEKR